MPNEISHQDVSYCMRLKNVYNYIYEYIYCVYITYVHVVSICRYFIVIYYILFVVFKEFPEIDGDTVILSNDLLVLEIQSKTFHYVPTQSFGVGTPKWLIFIWRTQAAEAVTLSARRQWQQRGWHERHKRIDAHLQTYAECKSHVKPPCVSFSLACIPRILQPLAHCFVPSRINAVALLKIYNILLRILYAVCFS